MKTTDLATVINHHADKYEYFWAYGILKETAPLWEKDANKSLLNDTAQIIVNNIKGEGKV